MSLDDAFGAPRAGDLLLTADESLTSRFIRRWTRSEWSHVALVVGPRDPVPGGFIALEVSPPRVRFVEEHFYRGRYGQLVRPPLDVAQRHAVVDAARRHEALGFRYPKLGLLAFALRESLRPRAEGALVCSGTCAWLLSRAASVVWRGDDGRVLDPASQVRPDHIADQAYREGWGWAPLLTPPGHAPSRDPDIGAIS